MQQFRFAFHWKPDSGWAWMILISVGFINAIIFGLFRSYGVIFVELLDHYGVSRQTAAWPFSVCMTVAHLSGIRV